MAEYRELKSWITDILNRVHQQPEPQSVAEAETALNLHQERRTEIDGKYHRFISFQSMGRELNERARTSSETSTIVSETVPHSSESNQKEISRLMKELMDGHSELLQRCDDKQRVLREASEWQELRESWKQLEAWANNIEATLRSKETGDSVLSVKSLLQKADSVEQAVRLKIGEGGAFEAIELRGGEMMRQNYQQKVLIVDMVNEAQMKRKEMQRLCALRRKTLEDALMFQNFLLNYYEAQQWIKEKTASALDKTYLDLTNLVTKIQRHQAFIGELKKSGEKRMEGVHAEADTLLARHQTTAISLGPDSEKVCGEIQQYVKDLNGQWNALKAATDSKRKCLEDSHKCVTFTRLCGDLVGWCDEIEAQLASDDNGHDLSSCKLLLLRHESLSRQIFSYGEKVKEIEAVLESSGANFMYGKMKEACEQVRQSYGGLQEPAVIRKENLEESLSFFTVMHDLDDSLQFITEKEVCLSEAGKEMGESLAEVTKLQRRHVQLESEVHAQQTLILGSVKAGRQLIERKHYAHGQISIRVGELEERWSGLKAVIDRRGKSLNEAVEVQKFYSGCDELTEWLKEKRPILASTDYGKDDLAAISYLKKLEVLMVEMNGRRRSECESLVNVGRSLIGRDNYDKKNVGRRIAEVEGLLEVGCNLGKERQMHIRTMLKVFEFERECEANVNWLKDQQVVAASQDFGTDLEHAEALLVKFNEFVSELNGSSMRVARIDEMAQDLCENEYTPGSFIERIDEKCSALNEMWKELSTLAEVRRQTLEGAIEVHAFDKDCDDLITWAVEKESFVRQEEIGLDLASVFTLAKQQESLEGELIALKEELERLNGEAARLGEQYPETKEHIETRLEDAETTYGDFFKQLHARKEKIKNSQSAFLLSNEFSEISEWLREVQARITMTELGCSSDASGGVNNAEMLVKKHRECKVEIDLQQPKIQKFINMSDGLSEAERRVFSSKTEAIRAGNRSLLETWQSRQELYEQNLEYNKVLREIRYLDAWLSAKDGFVHTDLFGDSVQSVETLLKQHDDLEGMLKAMEERFESLKKENKLEKTLREIRQREMESREQQERNFEQEKKKEAERKRKVEKRRQDERRRTQEIISIVSAAPVGQKQIGEVNVPVVIVESSGKTGLAGTFAKTIEASTFEEENGKRVGVEQVIPIVVTQSSGSGIGVGGLKARKDRNRTRSIRDRYKLPIRLPQPTIKGNFEEQKKGLETIQIFY